jgi:AcrR family transcriptional regulator
VHSGPIDRSEAKLRPNLLAGQQFPPRPQQLRSKQKRDALLQAALSLFAERGYEATTIEEIAHQAGVAVGGFYQHFASKQQLLLVLMDSLLDGVADLSQQCTPLDDPREARSAIERVVRQGLLIDRTYAGAYRAWREATALHGALRALHEQIEQWTGQQIEQMLAVLLQTPGAREDVDVTPLAGIVSVLFWRLADVPLHESDAVVTSMTTMLYHTIFHDAAP